MADCVEKLLTLVWIRLWTNLVQTLAWWWLPLISPFFISVKWPWLIKATGMLGRKTLYTKYLTKFSLDLGWNWSGVEVFCSDKAHIHFISCHQHCNLGRGPCLDDFVKKVIGSCLDMNKLISFKFGTIIDTSELYSSFPGWMAMIFIQGHSCLKMQRLLGLFSHEILS